MAREMLLTCDKCDRKNGARTEVLSFEGRRSDGLVMTVDLCTVCWRSLEKDYGFRELHRNARRSFTVLDSPADIPRKK